MASSFVVPLDVQPVSGDEATALQEMIVDGVRQRLARQGVTDVDTEMASFLRSTKQYGAKEGALSAAEYWRVVARHRVAAMFTAPTALRALRKVDPETALAAQHDLSSLCTLWSHRAVGPV